MGSSLQAGAFKIFSLILHNKKKALWLKNKSMDLALVRTREEQLKEKMEETQKKTRDKMKENWDKLRESITKNRDRIKDIELKIRPSAMARIIRQRTILVATPRDELSSDVNQILMRASHEDLVRGVVKVPTASGSNHRVQVALDPDQLTK